MLLPRLQTGWDTDQFMTDERETTLLWWTLLRHGGIAPGADSAVNGTCTPWRDALPKCLIAVLWAAPVDG